MKRNTNINTKKRRKEGRARKTNRNNDVRVSRRRRDNKDEAKQTLVEQPVFGHLETLPLLGWRSL